MEDRTAKLIFKLAVEMSMMMNILAANLEIDEEVLKQLRGKCIKEIASSIHRLDANKMFRDM